MRAILDVRGDELVRRGPLLRTEKFICSTFSIPEAGSRMMSHHQLCILDVGHLSPVDQAVLFNTNAVSSQVVIVVCRFDRQKRRRIESPFAAAEIQRDDEQATR